MWKQHNSLWNGDYSNDNLNDSISKEDNSKMQNTTSQREKASSKRHKYNSEGSAKKF